MILYLWISLKMSRFA